METIIERIQKLNSVFRSSAENLVPLREFCEQLSAILNSNIYLFFSNGEIFCYATSPDYACRYNDQALSEHRLPDRFLRFFSGQDHSVFNVYEKDPPCTCEGISVCRFRERFFSMIPIYSASADGAGILMIRYGKPFAQDEEILCEYTAVVASLELLYRAQSRIKQDSLQMAYSQLATKALSNSELHAVQAVLDQINGNSGTVISAAAASSVFVTQSVVSSALKKLESAGVISTRSLGIKGKHITICNEYLRRDLSRRLGE